MTEKMPSDDLQWRKNLQSSLMIRKDNKRVLGVFSKDILTDVFSLFVGKTVDILKAYRNALAVGQVRYVKMNVWLRKIRIGYGKTMGYAGTEQYKLSFGTSVIRFIVIENELAICNIYQFIIKNDTADDLCSLA